MKKSEPFFIDYTNDINPLFGFKRVTFEKKIKTSNMKTIKSYEYGESMIQTGKLINIVNHGPESSKNVILATDRNNFNVSKYEVHNGKLVKAWE